MLLLVDKCLEKVAPIDGFIFSLDAFHSGKQRLVASGDHAPAFTHGHSTLARRQDASQIGVVLPQPDEVIEIEDLQRMEILWAPTEVLAVDQADVSRDLVNALDDALPGRRRVGRPLPVPDDAAALHLLGEESMPRAGADVANPRALAKAAVDVNARKHVDKRRLSHQRIDDASLACVDPLGVAHERGAHLHGHAGQHHGAHGMPMPAHAAVEARAWWTHALALFAVCPELQWAVRFKRERPAMLARELGAVVGLCLPFTGVQPSRCGLAPLGDQG
mmetsp:Transcript_32739/g.99007  ORF Transcript_32739/g.99007 Transcript_32739/m.99007 type:complete len:276 (-) Transcript_32739:114-941(-)|eukprot:CAMPEP_0198574718 /NCGR_PEP_ID=MMETSP1462-20131121/115098_1 /TAXON_ID=1333877 /ORGANISM="Brandtodinium nutriculum, Strain RCC3387" /LENGTH=275 /DNA_ID=CAMNT_0044305943 /DNA_START=157 /DNA_END=984 /DNA_ORIENTATION=-